ncbi:plasmid replication initiator TrfA [Commensalibacter sp. ESL0382]|uniref:plasmid replication initiator TrfA n=1 Tax=Commensalibacter sp. ESL0382 TaxID=2676445 RepID=UPI0012D88657|nr:replication initiator protein A [Commensalibacter sp. ESL0382]MUG35341.1 RepB family plasmid replication initiator protein [Commensalibacter sp. ESL0382]
MIYVDNTIQYECEATQKSKKKKHLSPKKHKQTDFFIADIFNNLTFQDDIASMEHPLFALKAGDKKVREYIHNNFSIVIAPNVQYGMATIHDKDIWIYCISKLMQAIYEEKEISRTIHFTIYDYLITTNRGVDGRYYEKAKDALDRLSGTRITTNIETAKTKEAHGFGLIDAWRVVEEKDGRMVRVSVTLPDWLYRSITSNQVLTISSDYFRLRKPLDRRIYELARKHCGSQKEWKIGLELLLKKTGSSQKLKVFRWSIKSLITTNELPDYSVAYDLENDVVIFTQKQKSTK